MADTTLSGSPASLNTDVSSVRDAYMQYISDNFSEELLSLHALDGSADAVRYILAAIEDGLDVWGYPLKAHSI